MKPNLTRYALYALVGVAGGTAVVAKMARDRAKEREAASTKPDCCCTDAGVSAPPEPQFDVPDFSLTERRGRAVALKDLRSKVWIADFIYTTCPGPCPMMSARMSSLVKELPSNDDLRFVSFSVDPAHDTPAVLEKYAQRFNAKDRWLFLTGPREEIHHLCVKGFRLALSEDSGSPDHPIVHSSKFALVDREGKVRGYYDGFEAKSLARLRADTIKLLEEKPPATTPAG